MADARFASAASLARARTGHGRYPEVGVRASGIPRRDGAECGQLICSAVLTDALSSIPHQA